MDEPWKWNLVKVLPTITGGDMFNAAPGDKDKHQVVIITDITGVRAM